jgi:hypothetical protein
MTWEISIIFQKLDKKNIENKLLDRIRASSQFQPVMKYSQT